jgi:hypothetical protein
LNLLRDKPTISTIDKLSERLNNLYPNPNPDVKGLGITHWDGKKIIPLDEWIKISNSHKAFAHGDLKYQKTEEALKYFPDDYTEALFPVGVEEELQEQANKWYSDYLELMKYRKNPAYGKTKCFHCLLSTFREEAAFCGINKVLSKTLDTPEVTVYPCPVMNRFTCPYDRKTISSSEKEVEKVKGRVNKEVDIDELFLLSEVAFAVELSLAKAQSLGEDSVCNINSPQDAYQVLTSREALEKILQQGLEEKVQFKDEIVQLFMNIREKIRMEDLTVYPVDPRFRKSRREEAKILDSSFDNNKSLI